MAPSKDKRIRAIPSNIAKFDILNCSFETEKEVIEIKSKNQRPLYSCA